MPYRLVWEWEPRSSFLHIETEAVILVLVFEDLKTRISLWFGLLDESLALRFWKNRLLFWLFWAKDSVLVAVAITGSKGLAAFTLWTRFVTFDSPYLSMLEHDHEWVWERGGNSTNFTCSTSCPNFWDLWPFFPCSLNFRHNGSTLIFERSNQVATVLTPGIDGELHLFSLSYSWLLKGTITHCWQPLDLLANHVAWF